METVDEKCFLPSQMLNISSSGNSDNDEVIKKLVPKFCKVPSSEAMASQI
jgi:hypothetical protein